MPEAIVEILYVERAQGRAKIGCQISGFSITSPLEPGHLPQLLEYEVTYTSPEPVSD